MKKQTIIALCVFLVFGLLQMVSFSAAETPKYEAGLTISTSKSTYQITENVRFILVKKTGVDDTPANLEGCYYIIQKKMDDDRWREFFTSDKNPFEITTLDLDSQEKLCHDLEKLIYNEAYSIFTYQQIKLYALKKKIKYTPHITGMLYLSDIELIEQTNN